ncbi:hypothetical protein PENTCL1PPCAC_21971, partial [Pristionchus entomophagus]
YIIFIIRDPQDLFLYKDSTSSIISMVFITIERASAYLRRRSYEKSSLRLGCILTICSVRYSLFSSSFITRELSLTFLLQYGVYIHYDFGEVRSRCTVITPSGEDYHQIMAIMQFILLGLELLTIMSYTILLRRNRAKLARGCETLTERFQLSENVRSLEFLVPIILSTTGFNVAAIFMFVLINSLNLDKRNYALCEYLTPFLYSDSMLNISSDEKDLANYLANSTAMHYVSSFIVLTIFSRFMYFLFIRDCSSKCFIAHRSLITLLAQHCLWGVIQSIGVIVDNCIVAYKHISYRSTEVLFLFNDGLLCFLRSGACMLAFQGGIYSLLVITVERYYASKTYATYEKSGLRLGIVLSFVHLILALSFFYLVVYFYDFDQTHARCIIASSKGMHFHKFQGV